MAVTYDSLKDLSRQTLKGLLTVQGWRQFLAFACRNFKLPFAEQVLVYAQRPEATALMKSGDWDTLGRPVKKSGRGIPVPEGKGKRLKYYYDISDTKETDASKPVPLWRVQPGHHEAIVQALVKYLGKLEDTSGFGEALLSAAKRVVACTVDDRMDELRHHVKNSLLEELDEDNLLVAYRTAMEHSVSYMLFSRCEVDPASYLTDEDYSCVLDFNTPSTLTILGSAVLETAAMCLGVIAKTVRRMPSTVPAPVVISVLPAAYAPGERFTIAGASEFEVVDVNEANVLYSFLDLPEQEPVSAARKDFDAWLAAGFIQPARQAVPA